MECQGVTRELQGDHLGVKDPVTGKKGGQESVIRVVVTRPASRESSEDNRGLKAVATGRKEGTMLEQAGSGDQLDLRGQGREK